VKKLLASTPTTTSRQRRHSRGFAGRVSTSQSDPFTTAAAVQAQLPSALVVRFGRDGGRKRQSRIAGLALLAWPPAFQDPAELPAGRFGKGSAGSNLLTRRRVVAVPHALRKGLRSPRRSQPSPRAGHHQRLAIQLRWRGKSATRMRWHGFTLTRARARAVWWFWYSIGRALDTATEARTQDWALYCSLFRIFRTDFL